MQLNNQQKKEIIDYVSKLKLCYSTDIWETTRKYFEQIYRYGMSTEAYRHIWRSRDKGGYFRLISKEEIQTEIDKLPKDVVNLPFYPEKQKIESCVPNKEIFEIKNDGTSVSTKILKLSETDSKNPNSLLVAHGFDPKQFTLVSAVNNLWGSTSDEKLQNYQSKISVKPIIKDELTREDVIDLAKNFTYKHDTRSYRYALNQDEGKKALQVNLGDLHIGAFGWEQESGENNDYKIIEGKVKEIVAKIKKLIESDKRIDTLYLIFGGDILHVDNEQGETSGGTQVQLDGRAKKMVQVAYRILSYMIINVAIVEHVFIKVLEGNHSRILEFAIFEGLKNMFSEHKNIEFDNSPMARKAFLYGKNLIGLAHGDLSNKKNYNWLQLEFRELWGMAKHAEIHLFHLHKEESETTEGGITIRRNPTIKPTDHYEYFNAFIGADKKVACYIWDKEGGLESIRYFRSMFTIK